MFEEEHKKTKPTRLLSESEKQERKERRDLAAKHARWRKRFLKNLERKGVIIKKVRHIGGMIFCLRHSGKIIVFIYTVDILGNYFISFSK